MFDNAQRVWHISIKNSGSSRIYVAYLGLLAGFTGSIHGLAEASRGNMPTEGLLLNTIGAFTIIPDYLAAGIATILIALTLACWSVFFIRRKNGIIVLILLSILLFLIGGGIAQLAFFPFLWGVASRLDKPLAWWKKVLPGDLKTTLAGLWPIMFIAVAIFLTAGVGIWLLLTPPGTTGHAPIIYYVCWTCLAIGFLLQIPTIVSGFARDIVRQETRNSSA